MTEVRSTSSLEPALQTSWLPMLVIAMAQILLSFNVNALRVSIGGIVSSFGASPSVVGTAIVTHLLFIAALVMLGAKIGALWGPRPVFQAAVLLFGVAMFITMLSPNATMMIAAQGLAGMAAAALVPTLVVLIAANYQGRRQAQAIGWLGASEAMGGVLAFLIAGFLGTWIGWRYSFGVLGVLAAGVLLLSKRLSPVEGRRDLRIDAVGVALAALAIILISVGFDSANRWGLLLAAPGALFSLLGLSPAPVMIILGIVLGQAFFTWSNKRRTARKTPLVALEVIETPQQRSALFLMFMIVALGSAVSFLIPLYIEIVQGLNSLRAALAIIPYSLAIFRRRRSCLAATRLAQLAPRGTYRVRGGRCRVDPVGHGHSQRVAHGHGDFRADRHRVRAGRAGDGSVQRPGCGIAAGAGRGCGLAARRHQQSCGRGGHRPCQRALDRRAERECHDKPSRQPGDPEGAQGAGRSRQC